MKRLPIILKTVTPMFLAGANGRTPELRAPSIKGMMRFWWRAIRGDLSIERLRDEECEIFGSSDEGVGRSKFSLRIYKPELETYQYCPVPTRSFQIPAFKPDGSFGLMLSAGNSFDKFKMVCNLMKISLILGGLGKRSRRGFGSLRIDRINGSNYVFDYSLNSICDLLNAINPDSFRVDGSKIKRRSGVSPDADYPYVKEIEIGRPCNSWESLLEKIGKASHDYDCYHTGFVERSHRFASPVYVSIIQNNNGKYQPVVTTLNCAFKGGFNSLSNNQKKTDKTDDFKRAVLS